jgi:hypothetical protein
MVDTPVIVVVATCLAFHCMIFQLVNCVIISQMLFMHFLYFFIYGYLLMESNWACL